MGYAPECKPFESHGYKQSLQLINGELTERDAVFYAQRNTRHYAKRQITWFRREQALQWLKGFGDTAHIREAALKSTAQFLSLEA
jgi:tRNA dimethylallyltransferase